MNGSDSQAPPMAPTPAKARVVHAALRLFAVHGVGGTSLQMIADDIGVTKAAVYHQYQTKEEIVLAAAEYELEQVRTIVAVAEAAADPVRARDLTIEGIVDLAIERRRTTSTILGDPVIAGHFADHDGFRDLMHRLRRLLMGDGRNPEARVRTAMLVASLSGAATHPFVVGLDDDVVRAQLRSLAKGFIDQDATAQG